MPASSQKAGSTLVQTLWRPQSSSAKRGNDGTMHSMSMMRVRSGGWRVAKASCSQSSFRMLSELDVGLQVVEAWETRNEEPRAESACPSLYQLTLKGILHTIDFLQTTSDGALFWISHSSPTPHPRPLPSLVDPAHRRRHPRLASPGSQLTIPLRCRVLRHNGPACILAVRRLSMELLHSLQQPARPTTHMRLLKQPSFILALTLCG